MTVVGVDLENVLRMAISELTNAGVEGAIIDSRILASAAFDLSREEILREPDATLKISDIALFKEMLNRRCAREPVSRILGMREFRGLEFKVAPSTLDPRPDSETIVEAVFDIASEMPDRLRILDLGTGTGCLLLSVLHALPAARGVGTEIDPDAAACAIQNAQALGLSDRAEIVCGNWVEGLTGRLTLFFRIRLISRLMKFSDWHQRLRYTSPSGLLMVVLTVWMLTEKYPNFSGNFYHLRAGLYSKLALSRAMLSQ